MKIVTKGENSVLFVYGTVGNKLFSSEQCIVAKDLGQALSLFGAYAPSSMVKTFADNIGSLHQLMRELLNSIDFKTQARGHQQQP